MASQDASPQVQIWSSGNIRASDCACDISISTFIVGHTVVHYTSSQVNTFNMFFIAFS